MLPSAKRLYARLFADSVTVDLSKEFEALADLDVLKCKVAFNKYGGYCVPLSSHHRPAPQMILSGQVHEPKTIEYIIDNCDNGDVVHAGAYFGGFLPALSKAVAPGARIWAFEPNPENYRCARVTLEINGINNAILMNTGLGSRKDNLRIKTTDANGCALGGESWVMADDANEEGGTESVRINVLDDVVGSSRTVSIIQLDVEGYEQEALTGALRTIRRCLPIIILEVLPGNTLLDGNWFASSILSLGYRRTLNLHGNSVFSCRHHARPTQVQLAS